MSEGGGHRRRGHEVEHEEHENHERWLVSYADMMTLLMVLFIVLFAISQVDQKKFAALKNGLAAGFGAPVAVLPGADSLLDPGGSIAPDSVNLAGSAGGKARNAQIAPAAEADPATQTAKAIKSKDQAAADAAAQAAVKAEVDKLKKAQGDLQKALKRAGLPKKATFRFNERGLVVSIATDNVLFQSGSATLEPQGEKILDVLAPTLAKLPNQLSIDGHTNNIPIHTAQFPSNWYLSADRAVGVLQYLKTTEGIPFQRMSATGYGDTEPRLPAGNPRSVSVNRRVEIVVVANVADSAGQEVAQLGNTKSTS